MNEWELLENWQRLVKESGVQPPNHTDSDSLRNWARPESPSAARKFRPQLLEIYQKTREGNLSDWLENLKDHDVDAKYLTQYPSFEKIMQISDEVLRNSPHYKAMNWIRSWNPDAAELFAKKHSESINALTDYVETFLNHDVELFNKAKQYEQKYNTETEHLRLARRALDNPQFSKRQKNLDYLNQFMELVSRPILKAILYIEGHRDELKQHCIDLVSEFILQSVGAINPPDLPDLDNILELTDALPAFQDRETFEEFKNSRALDQLNTALDNYVEEFQNRIGKDFDNYTIDRDIESVIKGEQRLQVNIMVIEQGGKGVIQNNQNQFGVG